MTIARRRMLAFTVGAAAVPLLNLLPTPVRAEAGDAQKLIEDFTGGQEPQSGKLRLTAPEIAENGNTVPVSVDVDSAMEGDDMVESIMIIAEDNPRPEVATFHFTALSGAAAATTRMRLAQSQHVVALARMADGTVHSDRREVKVTIGGCGG